MYLTVNEYLERASNRDTELIISMDEGQNGWDLEDEAILTVAIKDASNHIDGYMRHRYLLPLDETPDLIKRICFVITRKYIYSKKSIDSKTVRQEYEEALSDLERIRLGTIVLNIPSLDDEQASLYWKEGTPKFSSNILKDY